MFICNVLQIHVFPAATRNNNMFVSEKNTLFGNKHFTFTEGDSSVIFEESRHLFNLLSIKV